MVKKSKKKGGKGKTGNRREYPSSIRWLVAQVSALISATGYTLPIAHTWDYVPSGKSLFLPVSSFDRRW
jgi:hypothetical protein